MELEEAKKIVLDKITRKGKLLNENPPVFTFIENYSFGWLFFYNGKTYVDTGNQEDSYIGNIPILVDKIDETLHYMGDPLMSTEELIEKYKIQHGYR